LISVPGNQKLVRETNQKLIIDILRQGVPTSRADLAKQVNLSAPSISTNVDQLLERKIIKEIGAGDSILAGRKPMLLDFNREYGYIFGIDLSSEEIRVAVGDLLGNILEIEYVKLPERKIGTIILDKAIECIYSLMDKRNIEKDRIIVISIGTPGVINEETGELQMAPQFEGWDKLNVKKTLEKEFQTKIIIKNDINLAAIGESSYGIGKGYSNLIFISLDIGVGSGIIIDGSIYEGTRHAAGEIAYWVTSIEEMVNRKDSSFGSMESKISIPALVERVKNDIANGKQSRIYQLAGQNIDKIQFSTIKKAVSFEDEYSIEVIKEVSRFLALMIVNMSVLLDIELIIIGGEITELGYSFLQPIREALKNNTPLSTTVAYSQLGSKSVIYGSFVVALDYAFKHILD
jgi:N-acetylglucosamine repressor